MHTITTEKIVFGGKALARIDGKAVFIPFALPQEELEIAITQSRRDYNEAVITKILTPSPHRVSPPCPYFGHCGGCNLQMAAERYQQTIRQDITAELFTRAHLSPEQPPVFVGGSAWEYRSRFQFHADKRGIIGMHGVASNTVIPVRDCPIAVPAIRKVLQQGKLASLFPSGKKRDPGRYHVFAQDSIYSPLNPEAAVQLHGKTLHFSVFGFFQSNLAMLENVIDCIAALPACTRILDFYAGVGTFSAFLTGKAEEIHLVEHNARALQTAQTNLQRIITEEGHTCRCFFHAVSDAQWANLPESRLQYDAAVIDPPRQGLHPQVISYLKEAAIPVLYYVSCNPATFVRDAKELTAMGYRFLTYRLFDFYPQTHHCELMGTFIR